MRNNISKIRYYEDRVKEAVQCSAFITNTVSKALRGDSDSVISTWMTNNSEHIIQELCQYHHEITDLLSCLNVLHKDILKKEPDGRHIAIVNRMISQLASVDKTILEEIDLLNPVQELRHVADY